VLKRKTSFFKYTENENLQNYFKIHELSIFKIVYTFSFSVYLKKSVSRSLLWKKTFCILYKFEIDPLKTISK